MAQLCLTFASYPTPLSFLCFGVTSGPWRGKVGQWGWPVRAQGLGGTPIFTLLGRSQYA